MISKEDYKKIVNKYNHCINSYCTCFELTTRGNCIIESLLNNKQVTLDEEYFKETKKILNLEIVSKCCYNTIKFGQISKLTPVETVNYLIYNYNSGFKSGFAYCSCFHIKNAISKLNSLVINTHMEIE